MDIAELLGRSKTDDAPDLPEDLRAPDYPPPNVTDDESVTGGSDLLAPDPKPKRDGRKNRTTAAPAKKATVAQQRQIRDALDLMLTTIGGGIAFRDPHCGGALSDHATNIAEKAVPLIARNPAWVEWFCGSTGFLDVLGLLIALRPVGSTFWGHHVTHTVGEGEAGVDLSAFTAPNL